MNIDRLGDVLLKSRTISKEQLKNALSVQNGQMLGEVLISLGFATSEDIARALSTQLNIPYLELGDDFKLEKQEVALVPEDIAKRYGLIPLKKTDEPQITLVMRDPLDNEAVANVRSITGLEIHKAVSTEERITEAINKFYRADAHIEANLEDLANLESTVDDTDESDDSVDSNQLKELANDAPVVRFVNLLLMAAVRDRASDIHFEPHDKEVHVRLRVDGMLHEVTPPPKNLYPGVVTRIKILARMDISERRLPLDGRFKFQANSRQIDVRVSSLPEIHGEKIVLRVLDSEAVPSGLNDLGFSDDMKTQFERILQSPHGIILVTGPTGSGKTSTLYSALRTIRTPERNIQTVEDPVEYQFDGINQMQVRPAIGLDFADCLRAILRQDPDVIMVGEIRDAETARIAMRASLTGHLVLSTLHTNDASSAFLRLKDIGMEPYLIGATVKLVVSQRLVRKICDACKEPITPPAELTEVVKQSWQNADEWTYQHGKGCNDCSGKGYQGRIAIFEFLETTSTLRSMLVEGKDEVAFRNHAVGSGMEVLRKSGFRLVEKGITTIGEILRVSPDEDQD